MSRIVCWRLLTLAVVLGTVGPIPLYMRGANDRGAIGGIVKDSTGKAVDGASVMAKNLDRGLSVTVISQEQGRYTAPNLLPGKYEVKAWGGGFRTDPSRTVELSAGQTAKADLSLAKLQDIATMNISQTAALMPEGEGKTIIVSLCTDCHKQGLYPIVARRLDRNGWGAIVKLMKSRPYGIVRSLDIFEDQEQIVLDYLAKNYGPDTPPLDPEKSIPRVWVKGEAAKGVVTEYDLPAKASPHDVAVDSKGIGWVSEGGHGVIGRFDPNTFTYTRFPLPDGKSDATAIGVDPKDHVWVFDGSNNRLVEYDPQANSFTSYPMPADKARVGANTIRFHPNGTVWFTGIASNQVVRVDPKTKEVKLWMVPSGVRLNTSVNPYGMAIDPSGMIWFAERRTDKMAKVEPRTGEITEFDIPTKGAVLRRMAADKDGNLWFGEYGGVGKLAKIDYRTGKVTEYPTPTKYSGAYSVDVDKTNHKIWFNEMMGNNIARFDPRAGTFEEYPVPSPLSSIRRIEVDQTRLTRVWYGGLHTDRVGFLDIPK